MIILFVVIIPNSGISLANFSRIDAFVVIIPEGMVKGPLIILLKILYINLVLLILPKNRSKSDFTI